MSRWAVACPFSYPELGCLLRKRLCPERRWASCTVTFGTPLRGWVPRLHVVRSLQHSAGFCTASTSLLKMRGLLCNICLHGSASRSEAGSPAEEAGISHALKANL